jgi:arabinose-5-phosphate isomerase
MEAKAIAALVPTLGRPFEQALDLIHACAGRVIVSGIGKAGIIGSKISATFASTGTPSFFLHPAEAIHGDLGRVRKEDIILLISNSGSSEEVIRLIDPLRKIGATLIAMTGDPDSPLGRNCDVVLDCGRAPEACPLGLAPTTSTATLLALGDALAMTMVEERDFDTENYARFHPGGALGRRLMKVHEIMRQGEMMTVVPSGCTAGETLVAMNTTKGRPGAAAVVDGEGRLVGFFTDGDLARQLQDGIGFLERAVDDVMGHHPVAIGPDQLASEAWRLMRERRVDQLVVVDDGRRPVGLIDVQDLLDARIV